MSTRFLLPRPTKSLPDCQAFTALVEALVTLLGAGSTAVVDFAGFLDPQSVHGQDTLRRIRNKIGVLPGNAVADTLFTALEGLHNACPAHEWNDRLGEVVECVIERLVRDKYPGVPIAREQRIEVSGAAGVVATTGAFPIDVIAWMVTDDHGEAIEVKKAIRSVVNDMKLLRKLRELGPFKQAAQAHAARQVFVGIANLLDLEEDARLYLETMLGGPTSLDLLARDNLAAWQAQRHL